MYWKLLDSVGKAKRRHPSLEPDEEMALAPRIAKALALVHEKIVFLI
jgi:hypothetical protein